MQPDSPLPPQPAPPTEPSVLDDMAALTGLFNPETIWKAETILDELDEQKAAQSTAPTPDQP